MKSKNNINYPKSAAMGVVSMGLNNVIETAKVNEPSVFQPLKFYCMFFFMEKYGYFVTPSYLEDWGSAIALPLHLYRQANKVLQVTNIYPIYSMRMSKLRQTKKEMSYQVTYQPSVISTSYTYATLFSQT